jgi:hypothetical protein
MDAAITLFGHHNSLAYLFAAFAHGALWAAAIRFLLAAEIVRFGFGRARPFTFCFAHRAFCARLILRPLDDPSRASREFTKTELCALRKAIGSSRRGNAADSGGNEAPDRPRRTRPKLKKAQQRLDRAVLAQLPEPNASTPSRHEALESEPSTGLVSLPS